MSQYVELIHITPGAEQLIEKAGRNCYNSSDKITEDSAGPFIRKLIKSGHDSPLEFAMAIFRLELSVVAQRQLTRHRHCSFAIRSQRYTFTQPEVYVPEELLSKRILVNYGVENAKDTTAAEEYMAYTKATFQRYESLVSAGVPKEDARYYLPEGTMTSVMMSSNLRNLRHVFKLRCDKHAQLEIRRRCHEMLAILKGHCPNVFYDLGVKEEEMKHI